MTAGQLFNSWSSAPDARRSHRVFVGPNLESIADAELHPVVDVYRDDQAEEIIVHHSQDSFLLSDDRSKSQAITCDAFLTRLESAMGENPDWPIEASTHGLPRDDAGDDGVCIRIDFPIGFAGGIDDSEMLLLLW